MIKNPVNKKNPPNPVTAKAVSALLRELSSSLLNPIRKNEVMLVSSQNMKTVIRLSDKTKPNIAPIKSVR